MTVNKNFLFCLILTQLNCLPETVLRQESSIDFEMKLLRHIEHIFQLAKYLRNDCEIDTEGPTFHCKIIRGIIQNTSF